MIGGRNPRLDLTNFKLGSQTKLGPSTIRQGSLLKMAEGVVNTANFLLSSVITKAFEFLKQQISIYYSLYYASVYSFRQLNKITCMISSFRILIASLY